MPQDAPNIAILGHDAGDGFLPFFQERAAGRFNLIGVDSKGLQIDHGAAAHESVSLDEIDFAVIRDLGDQRQRSVLEALERRIPFLNSVEAVAISTDKVLQSGRFRAHGVAIPDFVVVDHPDRIVAVEQSFGPPYVLKDPHLECGTGVFMLASSAELEDMLYYIWEVAPQRYPLLVQQYIACKGGEQRDERVVILDGEVLAVVGRVCGDRFKCNVFQGGRLVSSEISTAEADLARAALAAVGLRYGGVDLIRDASGQSFVLEVNASPGGLDLIFDEFGIDILASVADHIELRLGDRVPTV
ncbi:MAG: hypothetical protein JRF63_04750 [Deltaproteobacteria bacterium]|nr:hypothetical protein [Deltaproteobacteria bacterium]